MRGVVIVAGLAYGDGGGGIPGLVLGSPRDDAGNLIMLGTGSNSTGRRFTLRTWRSSSGGFWKPTRRVATTSSATDSNPPLPRSPRPPPSRRAPRGRRPAPTTRLKRAWATTSQRSSCSIRGPTPRKLEPSSTGDPPTQDSSTTSATGAIESKRRTPDQWRMPRSHQPRPRHRWAIRELFDAYAHCADRRDAEGQKALFTEDTHFLVYMEGD